MFDGVDYVALGHLHGCQTLADRVRYSGSPLPYSFSEAGHRKSMWLVDLDADGSVGAERVDCPVPRPLARIRGPLEDLLADPEHARHEESWVEATLTDPVRPAYPMARLAERFPHTLSLVFDPDRTEDDPDVSYARRLMRPQRPADRRGLRRPRARRRTRRPRTGRAAGRVRRDPGRRDRTGGGPVRLHRLTVTAFGPFGGTQTVDFDELSTAGLFLLHGPTGAGKTSVLDAVCYALYGSVPGARQGGGQGVTLRSDHAAPATRTEVALELTVAGRRLEVTRQPPWERPKKRGTGTTLDKAQTWLREYDAKAAAWKDLSRSHQEIGEEVTQLLGMSREQFCQVVLLPQGDFARFLRADAEARGKLLGRLFDTRRFADVEKRLAERRRATEAQVRDGDAALLADAHRMQQAAGDAMELPDLDPGEPGLAEAVLGAAAVARSTAREQLTVADCTLTAAESAQAYASTARSTTYANSPGSSGGSPRRGNGWRAWRRVPRRTGRRRRAWSGPARPRRSRPPWT